MVDVFLSQDWAGLIIALVVCAVGIGAFRLGRRIRPVPYRRLVTRLSSQEKEQIRIITTEEWNEPSAD